MKINRRDLVKASAVPIVLTAGGVVPALAQEAPAPPATRTVTLPVSADFPFEKKRLPILDSEIAYVDEGTGPIVLFLHGNPTSSYLWRNVIPHVVSAGYRAIAPDLIGMGSSGKPDIAYTFGDHATYLDAFIAAAGFTDITLAIHDWGSALGMRYARLNSGNVRAMTFFEALVPPVFPAESYEALGGFGELLRTLRTEGVGERMILDENFFVEQVLANFGVARGLTEEEVAHYREPYPTRESRLPTLQWPREVPIAGQPEESTAAIIANGEWLTSSNIPKLFFYASPGGILSVEDAEWIIANVPNLEARFVGRGNHFLQEDHPELLGRGIADWLRRTG